MSITRRRLFRATVGAAAAVVAVPALSGRASAHFPLELNIDVQPGNAENFIDLEQHDSVTVAVHPTEFLNGDGNRQTFDPTAEVVRYRFGSHATVHGGAGARPLGDGEVTELEGNHGGSVEALLLEFPVVDMGFDGQEETAWLYWEREDAGQHGYAGVDAVSVYGSSGPDRALMSLLRQLMGVTTGG
jgi:hypothetical protein